jgi:hypothetical protein
MRRRGRLAPLALLGGFVLMEPPVGTGGAPDTAKSVVEWKRVSAHDSKSACESARTARIADAEADLGDTAESDRDGTPLSGAQQARMAARCVPDTTLDAPRDAAH